VYRLNRAAFWLRSSDSRLPEVALQVGYKAEAAMSRAFKRCFGLSPGVYRRHSVASNGDGSAMHSPIEKVPLYPSEFRDGNSGLRTAAKATGLPNA